MKPFESFLNGKDVKKSPVNIILARALINDMKTRIKENWDLNEKEKAKTIFENIYEAIRCFCDALLTINGFKSYSHEASISYLLKKDFDVASVQKFDNFRFKRNGSRYYGRIILPEDAKEIKEFYMRIKEKINKVIKENNLN
jgi:hypothetical protein